MQIISKTHVTHFLTEKLSTAISPTLFTPPAAQHMPCTDAIARLWSPQAVLPVLTPSAELTRSVSGGTSIRPRGMADAFGMLGAWVEGSWDDGVGSGVCEECLAFLREEWRSEARAIWGKMDGWVEEAEKVVEEKRVEAQATIRPL